MFLSPCFISWFWLLFFCFCGIWVAFLVWFKHELPRLIRLLILKTALIQIHYVFTPLPMAWAGRNACHSGHVTAPGSSHRTRLWRVPRSIVWRGPAPGEVVKLNIFLAGMVLICIRWYGARTDADTRQTDHTYNERHPREGRIVTPVTYGQNSPHVAQHIIDRDGNRSFNYHQRNGASFYR